MTTQGSSGALVLQMVRAHFRGDDRAFAGAAMSLANQAKSPVIRNGISSAIYEGNRTAPKAAVKPHQPASFAGFQPAPALAAPQSKMLETLKPMGLADLMLDPDLEQTVREIVVELEYREELAKRNLRARNRLLFWGSPGNGKTSVAAAIAGLLGVPAYAVSLPNLISKYIGETGQNLGQLFDAIKSDTVVVFDEIDAIGSARGRVDQSSGKEANSQVNTILTLLDRHEKGVLIATTNRPDILDPALLRRFDEQIRFPDPNELQKRGLAAKLSAFYGVPEVNVHGCENFDAVTKTVMREARRMVMAEILAADTAEEEDEVDGE